jgi:amino acid transporter
VKEKVLARISPSTQSGVRPPRREHSGQLQGDSATTSHVIAQGIIANGPLLCMGAVMTSAAIYAQGSLPLAYLLGAVVVWLWVNTPLQYSKRLASAGGMFYFVSKGTSPLVGFLAGTSYALYYTAFAAAGAVYFSVMAQGLLAQFKLNSGPGWIWDALPVLLLVVPGILVYRGIRPSLRYGLVAGLAELGLMVVAALAIVFLAGRANTLSVFSPAHAAGGFSGVGIGLLLAAFGMSGSTATVYLGQEARLPHASIRRGLLWSTSIVVAVFMLVSYAVTIGWGPNQMAGFANSNIPGLLVIGHFLGSGFELVVAAFMLNSIISAIVASSLVVSRVSYSMSQAGLLPRALGRVDQTSGSPRVAVVACYGLAMVGAAVASVTLGPVTAFTVLILVGTLGEFVGHILGNLALPGFAHRRRSLSPVVHVLVPLASLITTGIGIYYTFFPVSFPTAFGPLILIVGLAMAALHFLRLRPGADQARRDAMLAGIDQAGTDLDGADSSRRPIVVG